MSHAAAVGKLREICGAEHAGAGGTDRYRIGRMVPWAAVRPAGEAQVSGVLRLAAEERLAVVPWGAGTHQVLGARPARYDLALDMTRLDRLVAHEPADLTATVQAGARLGPLQARLAAAGSQWLPLDPPHLERASLGGILAANLSGPLRCRAGTARDLVLGVRVAHPDGTITTAGAKVVKNATAYDLTKLYLGSQGTLAVILEATLRLAPLPAAERGWWIGMRDLDAAQALAHRLLGAHLAPSRVELLNAGAATQVGLPAEAAGLLVTCAGISEAVDAQGMVIERLARESGAGTRPVEAEPVRDALRDFPWADGLEGRASWRASVLPAECGKALQAIAAACAGTAPVAAAATVTAGVLRGQVAAPSPATLVRALAAAREAIHALGGFLVVLDAPDEVRQEVPVWGPEPDGLETMRRLKRAFDPGGVLNPGRFVGNI
jgi:glycolate oxidase FAD binding subunit